MREIFSTSKLLRSNERVTLTHGGIGRCQYTVNRQIRASPSSFCYSRTSKLATNTSRYLWRCRQASAVNTVLPKRFYADEKSTRLSDAFPATGINEKKANLFPNPFRKYSKDQKCQQGYCCEDRQAS
ncbi:hypothetical protein ACROYT_G021465 [Oculina patagonica]